MPVSDKNQQIAVVLPKDVVEILDKYAEQEMRTRSKAAAKILIDYLRELGRK